MSPESCPFCREKNRHRAGGSLKVRPDLVDYGGWFRWTGEKDRDVSGPSKLHPRIWEDSLVTPTVRVVVNGGS